MTTSSGAHPTASATRLAPNGIGQRARQGFDIFLLAGWCGLAAGILEVGTRVLGRTVYPSGRLYLMSRHFVWAGPLANLLLFLALGLLLALATWFWPRVGGWLSLRLIVALALTAVFMAAGPRIYTEAWAVLALGIAIQAVPFAKQPARAMRRWFWLSFPLLLAAVAVMAGSVLVSDRLKERREERRPLPSSTAPNVLLIVMDTVRADHLSLDGYRRRTTPNLDRLAQRGIQLAEARAAAPWTIPSHANMFTGRPPHELATEWLTPVQSDCPTLAEYLGSRGYATAGFVGNLAYCSYATGLDRGFTHYEDYVLKNLSALQTAGLIAYAIQTFNQLTHADETGPFGQLRTVINRWFVADARKPAAAVNGSFLKWLSQRPSPTRPFLVFLNYMDAHASYVPPARAVHRFGSYPQTPEETAIVYGQWALLDKTNLPQRLIAMGLDSYDDCVGYIDDQIGLLLAELERRGVLERTLVIVTSDHGEGFGEHDLFDHGKSLYRPEIRVPLVIVPPGYGQRRTVIHETVSLGDLPATIVDLTGLAAGSPFPGQSLASLWGSDQAKDPAPERDPVISELATPNPINPNYKKSPALTGPLISIALGDFVYIRNEKDGSEELFNVRDDPRELTNRARNGKDHDILERFRSLYSRRRPATGAARARVMDSIASLDITPIASSGNNALSRERLLAASPPLP